MGKPRSVREVISNSLRAPRMPAGLLNAFGLLALGVVVDRYPGVMACSGTQRRREIGIRIVLRGRGNVPLIILG